LLILKIFKINNIKNYQFQLLFFFVKMHMMLLKIVIFLF